MISEGFASTSGHDESLGDDFSTFFQKMTSGTSSPSGTASSSKAAKPPQVPGMRTKSQGTSSGGLRGTLCTCKRKFEFVSSFSNDLSEGELDPIAIERVSHLARYIYYSAENITLEAAAEIDRLGLSKRYGRALKASQDVTFLLSHCLLDIGALTGAQVKIEKLRGELRSHKNQEDMLIQEVKALRVRLDDLSGEKAWVNNECNGLRAKYKELLYCQKKMASDAFTRIKIEV